MPAQAKLELVLELKNKLKGGYAKAKAQLKGQMTDLKQQVTSMKEHHVRAFSAMKDQVPGLSSAMNLLTNPYVLVTAGVVALTAAMWNGVKAAGAYNNEFLELRNLNLDKTSAQLNALSGNILDVAFKEGFDAQKTAQGYYDVQSALGIYGDEVEQFVTKVGRFSKATKADFNESINAGTKAMKAFGFGVERIDEYLASNAKTVQVGITTFKELAQVQTEYGGAAAAAGSDFNIANKVFAAFTSIAKDSAMAATMTKAAFTGLTKKRTIEGVKTLGIDMLDSNDKMRDMGDIIQELVPKIQRLSDKSFLELRNQIRGPEGLQNLFNKMRTSGDDLLKTFEGFDKSQFDINKALKNAKNDFQVLREEVGNRFNNIMIRLGNSVMPGVIKGLKGLSGFMDVFRSKTERLTDKLAAQKDEYNRLKNGIIPLLDRYDELRSQAKLNRDEQTELKDTINKISDALPGATTYFDSYGNAMDIASGKARNLVKHSKEALAIINEQAIGEFKKQIFNYNRDIKFLQAQLNSGKSYNTGTGATSKDLNPNELSALQARITGTNELMITAAKELAKLQGTKFINPFNIGVDPEDTGLTNVLKLLKGKRKNAATVDDEFADGGDGNGGMRVVGDVRQVKNITVNFQAMHQGDNIVQNEAAHGMTVEELEEWHEELLLRSIRSVEGAA